MAATGCAPSAETVTTTSSSRLDRATLEAVGRIVLPVQALGDDGVSTVLDEFEAWVKDFEPVAELDHPYLWTDEIRYGPPDPAPRWASQLEALELEATKRHGASYAELDAAERKAILERQLPSDVGSDLPYAGEATHVAVGLLAYFYRTSRAHDLGYEAVIEKQTCRGLDTGPDEPAPLGD